MRSLPAALIFEKNRLATPSAWIILLEITLPDSTVLRFARNTEDITFSGDLYTAFPFEIDTVGQSSKGEIPTVRLRVSNVTQLIQPYLEDLDGGIGSVVKITVVNSDHLSENYTELEMTFDVIACNSTSQWVTFTLGAPNPLRQRFPLDQYIAMHCRWRFNRPSGNYPECSYSGKNLSGITLSSGNPVSINSSGHGFSTNDLLSFLDVGGTTELNGNSYTITRTDDNNFTLNGTDGDDFTAWTSGGTAGHSTCNRTFKRCKVIVNTIRYGGFVGMRTGAVRIV